MKLPLVMPEKGVGALQDREVKGLVKAEGPEVDQGPVPLEAVLVPPETPVLLHLRAVGDLGYPGRQIVKNFLIAHALTLLLTRLC